LVEQLPF